MNLVVDIGNTLVKIALFDDGNIVSQQTAERLQPSMFDGLLAAWPAIDKAVVSSTRGDVAEVLEQLRSRVRYLLEFTSQTPVPVMNNYLTPATLGCDRLAAAVGATVLYPGRNVLIVDFGTAVTFDYVSAGATFCGGTISPGMQTRFRALHDYTATLPLGVPCDGEGLQGVTTEEAVCLGVMNSLTFEIEGYIARMREQVGDFSIIFTGGDAKFFVKRIKNTIFANYNLVFCGLNRILEYNASEEYLN